MEKIIGQSVKLIEVFQCAILDLAAKLESEKSSMSVEDMENVHYVVGMAQVNSLNLQKIIERGVVYYDANKEKVDNFLVESTRFAASLKVEGFGMADVAVDF